MEQISRLAAKGYLRVMVVLLEIQSVKDAFTLEIGDKLQGLDRCTILGDVLSLRDPVCFADEEGNKPVAVCGN